MKNKNDFFLYSVRDELTSNDSFNLYWDKKRKIAWTDVSNTKDLSKYYKSDQYISHNTMNKSFIQILYNVVRSIMFHYKYRTLKSFVKPLDKLLDIGCGVGNFLSFMGKKNLNVTGVENNSIALEICKKKNLKVYDSIENLSDELFDIVSLWHVLEHLPRPNKIIEKIYDLLSSEGVLVIAVPNFSSHDREHYQNRWAALDVPRHLWHFTPDGLEEMLSSAGFELLKKNPLFFDVFYISFLSEKHKGNKLAFILAAIKGCYFSILSFFTKKHSTISFVFKKQPL